MGLFDRLFRKPRPQVALSAEELPAWFTAQVEPRMRTFAQQAQAPLDRARALAQQLSAQIDALATARLQNENIHPKARAMMEGSRTQYLRAVQQFLAQLRIPETGDADTLAAFVTEFSAQLSQFTKATQRATAILSEFFAHAIKEIIGTFAGLERAVHEAYPTEYRTLIALRDRIAALTRQRAGKAMQAQRLAELQTQRAELTEQIRRFAAEQDAVQQEKEYQMLITAETQLRGLEQARSQQRTGISELFAPASAALKKLAHEGVQTTVIDAYLQDSAAALIADSELQILDALLQAQAQLAEGSIPLKEDKAERAKRGIASLTKELLTEQRAALRTTDDAIARLRAQIAGNVVRNRIAEADIRIAHLERQAQHATGEQEKIAKALAADPDAEEFPRIAAELATAFAMDIKLR